MNWPCTTLLLCTILLAGCSHDDNAADADSAAPPAADSAYTGLKPTYPKAKPVAAAAAPTQAAPAPSAPAMVAADTPQLRATPAPTLAKTDDASPFPSPAQETTPVAASLPSPATTPKDASAATAPIETTPTSPAVTAAPPRALSPSEARQEVIVLTTSLGTIVIELKDVEAPRTCGNFRKLVSDGFYNHTIFHRVIPHFMIQGGDPNSKGDDRRTYGLGDPGYTLPPEIGLKHVAGAVAMARLPDASNPQRESNGSQFFICAADCPSLDGQYTVFGQVIRGMDTVNKIASAPRDKNDDPTDRIEMQAALETKQQALEENPQ